MAFAMKPLRLASSGIAAVLIFLVRLYQWILSPIKNAFFGPMGGCRFRPTCSAYAIGCLKALPLHKALYYAARRVLRCHPWGGSGFDPIPKMAYRDDEDAEPVKSLKDVLEEK